MRYTYFTPFTCCLAISGYSPLITKHNHLKRHSHGLRAYIKDGFSCGGDAKNEDFDLPYIYELYVWEIHNAWHLSLSGIVPHSFSLSVTLRTIGHWLSIKCLRGLLISSLKYPQLRWLQYSPQRVASPLEQNWRRMQIFLRLLHHLWTWPNHRSNYRRPWCDRTLGEPPRTFLHVLPWNSFPPHRGCQVIP